MRSPSTRRAQNLLEELGFEEYTPPALGWGFARGGPSKATAPICTTFHRKTGPQSTAIGYGLCKVWPEIHDRSRPITTIGSLEGRCYYPLSYGRVRVISASVACLYYPPPVHRGYEAVAP